MKRTSFTFILSVALFTFSLAQVKNATGNVKQQANLMGEAFIKGDYKTFVKYNHPNIVKMMGGEAGAAKTIAGMMDKIKKQGFNFDSLYFGEPTVIIKNGTEYQCTILQTIVMTTPQGRYANASTLVAVSRNNGVNWTFIDTSNKDEATIRQVVQNLSHKLVIPPAKGPVKISD